MWAYVLVGAFVLGDAEIWCSRHAGRSRQLALAVPLTDGKGKEGPLELTEHRLGPWSSFLILPIFALANAGSSVFGDFGRGFDVTDFARDCAWSSYRKPLGIYSFAKAAMTSGLGARPDGATEMQLFGTAILGGIGFTMSLFIGMLAFPDTQAHSHVKLGVLSGSLMSAILGYFVLLRTNTRLRKGVTPRGGS